MKGALSEGSDSWCSGDGLEAKQPAGGWASDSSPYEISTNVSESFEGWTVGGMLRKITGSVCIWDVPATHCVTN